MLLFVACVLPVAEVYRGQVPVVVDVPGDVTVRACTWSKWNAVSQGCANLADGERSEEGPYSVKEFYNPITVILGEAPLMQTVYVACVDKLPRASAYFAWDAPMPGNLTLADGAHTSEGKETELTEPERAALLRGLCDGTVKAIPKP